jgi:hypothetical protein
MKNKKILLVAIALVAVLALFVGAYLLTRPDVQAGSKEITVTVVHGNGESKDFVYQTDAEFLGTVLQEEGLVEGVMGPYGLEIKVVDGEKAVYTEDNAYWALYEGDAYATTGADGLAIADGGIYKLVYTGA